MELNDFTKRQGTRVVSTTIPNQLWIEAKRNALNWNECLSFGIQFKLAERDILDYPQNKLQAKLLKLQQMLTEANEKLSKEEHNETKE